MKTNFYFFLLFCILMSMIGTKALAYDIEANNADGVTIYYNFINDESELEVTYKNKDFNSYCGSVDIPENVIYLNVSRKVTRIGTSAFYKCSDLTSVTIPNSVTTIMNSAFRECGNLTTIRIPNSITNIGQSTFMNCKSLTSITIPNDVTSIGFCAFSGCSSLHSVTFPNSLTTIGQAAFSGCSSLTSIIIPNSVTSIYDDAFNGCDSLISVYFYLDDFSSFCNNKIMKVISSGIKKPVKLIDKEGNEIKEYIIPNDVTNIGDGAFLGCGGLTSITIPNSVTTIGDRAFEKCTGLTSIMIPNNVTRTGSGVFRGCTNLTSVAIPNIMTSIEDDFFSGCSSMTSIALPDSLLNIGKMAFLGCSNLTSITIPKSVLTIGDDAFLGCSGLTSVHISDIGAWCRISFNYYQRNRVSSNPLYYAHRLFLNEKEIKDLILPNDVTRIGEFTFQNCSGLNSVTIPNSVSSIGYCAFDGCNLSEVISKIEEPFYIDQSTFSSGTYQKATLYVPKGSYGKYVATDGWKKFDIIKEGNSDSIKCEKPTINYQNGKLTFYSATEGAVCYSKITDSDIASYSTNEVQLGVTYLISVYAGKVGYDDSETATATLCWIDVEPKTDGLENDIIQVRSNAVMIKTEGGQLTVEGADDNTIITVFTLDGVQVGSAVSKNGVALVNTNVSHDSIAIVKIGNKSVKVVMK